MKRCGHCGVEFEGRTRLCYTCNSFAHTQSVRIEKLLRNPIDLCAIDGCNNSATATTLCEYHSKELITKSTENCKHYNCRRTAEVQGYCLHHIRDLELSVLSVSQIAMLKTSSDIAEQLPGDLVEEIIEIDCDSQRVLPEFIRNNDIIKKNSPDRRCESEYGCLSEVYKEGLCKVHYRMKHGLKVCKDDSAAAMRVRALLPKMDQFKPVVPCKSRGCSMIATHGAYCHSCFNKGALNRNKRIRKMLPQLRAGH